MTLSFSSFFIKDILTTGRGEVEKPGGTRNTAELCAPTSNICLGHGGKGVPDLSPQDVDKNRIHPQRPFPEFSVSVANLKCNTYSEESTEEETEHREGQQCSPTCDGLKLGVFTLRQQIQVCLFFCYLLIIFSTIWQTERRQITYRDK